MSFGQVIVLAGTDQFYRRKDGQPGWATRDEAHIFASREIARGTLRLLAQRGVKAQLIEVTRPLRKR